ncbi:unnamed protein product [Schistocephalus solidus]|uniref:Uncharacterized protein n=1 Tax=Schistocephalus solidus TaxID=70667 RepID=A0A183T3V3_SCHSO|nr:unnamed protein product [Schistocephalus solidus]
MHPQAAAFTSEEANERKPVPTILIDGACLCGRGRKTLKRLRKKANKSLLAESVAQQAQSSEEATHSTQVTHSCTSDQKHNHMTTAAVAVDTSAAAKRCRHNEEPTGPAQPPAKKHRHSSGKPKISKERLEAAGIDVKQFRYMHFNKERGSN